jgi:alpha-1,2-rhamnosyltransferase
MYLTVGTLEPRKNHKYLLDAFDLLWKQGEKVHLYIIGKVGWKCEDLLERIESHAEYGRRLMFYDNANDAELVACYKAAKAVVFASHVEGFGLPLVEAWQQGTPVYASDIPVFREIGGQDTSFFDLDDPASLAAIIRADQDNEPTVNSEWINWKQSAQQLYDAADRIASIRS